MKVHQHSAGTKKRGLEAGNKKIKRETSKIHAATDENRKVICIFITRGNVYDSTQDKKLLHDTIYEGVYVLGDKAFDLEQIVKYIEKNRGICVIPLRKTEKNKENIIKIFIKIEIK